MAFLKGYSETLAKKIQDTMFYDTGGTWSPTDILFCVLYTTVPQTDGTSGIEEQGGDYARQTVGRGAAKWDPAATPATPQPGEIETKNSTDIIFPAAAAPAWGDIAGSGIIPADGDLLKILVGGSFAGGAKPVPEGISPVFTAGSYKVSTYNAA